MKTTSVSLGPETRDMVFDIFEHDTSGNIVGGFKGTPHTIMKGITDLSKEYDILEKSRNNWKRAAICGAIVGVCLYARNRKLKEELKKNRKAIKEDKRDE